MVSTEVLELFHSFYLAPLRDAVQSLRPVKGNILGDLYSKLEKSQEKQKDLSQKVQRLFKGDEEWNKLIQGGKKSVNEHLNKTSLAGKPQNIEIDFLPFEFKRIVETLRVQLPIYTEVPEGVERKYFSLYENGLGYNNLIYVAVVLGDLLKKIEDEPDGYIALLIEEPEAHLHPQLQNILFSYLNEINSKGIQIFITSHSPTITAKAKLDSLIVLQNTSSKIFALPIAKSTLDESNKKYLHKFLDVTKAQLFFSNGVLLVEGISEALLLPVFANMMGNEYNLDKNGVEIVNISGIAFEHFGKLFNPSIAEQRLSYRCAILTDDDRDEDTEEIPSRAKSAKGLEGNLLRVELAENTFEYELFKTGNNRKLLLEIFFGMHPKAAANISAGTSIEEHAKNFSAKVASNKAKAELAHRLSLCLESGEGVRAGFTVPTYIQNGIRWVVKGE